MAQNDIYLWVKSSNFTPLMNANMKKKTTLLAATFLNQFDRFRDGWFHDEYSCAGQALWKRGRRVNTGNQYTGRPIKHGLVSMVPCIKWLFHRCYCTRVHWTSHLLQGTWKTRHFNWSPCKTTTNHKLSINCPLSVTILSQREGLSLPCPLYFP